MDDTDLLHIDLTKDERVEDVHIAIQESVNSWGTLLIATGEVLQPSKYFYSIISFKWTNGEWSYAENNIHGEYGITLPLPGGRKAAISHKSITHAEKTLGAMTSPDGDSIASICMMQDKAQQWINDVRGGHLHHHNVWFLSKVQFWLQVGYGLCSSMASFQDLEGVLHKQYYQISPLGEIVRTTPVESRTINAGFFGIGVPHLGFKALIAMTNKLLMHYGCKTATGQLMKTSYSLFFTELSLSFTPLPESYSCYGFLVTHSWMKMLWEKLSMFDIKVVIADIAHKYPRQGNQFIMQALLRAGYTGETLRQLSRLQISLQLLFMSDILTASGNRNTEILSRQPPGKTYSSMRWPNTNQHDLTCNYGKLLCSPSAPAGVRLPALVAFLGHHI